MAITAEDIHRQSFKIERRGYDVDEVDVFLERVASEIDEMNETIAALRGQLAEAQQAASAAPAADVQASDMTSAEKDARIAELESKLHEQRAEDNAIAQALIIAQKTGDEIVSKAKAEAEQTRINAEEEAARILDKANKEKQKVIDRINELNVSREAVRNQYQDLLKDFISSATKRLTEIGGDPTADFAIPDASDVAESAAASWKPSSPTAVYTTPTVGAPASAPATPTPMASKDFSGYGATDDSISFDEID